MWKKALWVYVVLWAVVILGGAVYQSVVDAQAGMFTPVAMTLPLLMLIPAVVLYLELKEKKVWVIFHIFGFLITAIPVVGIFNFNDFGLATIGKALLFVPMLVGLVYYGYKRLFKKKG